MTAAGLSLLVTAVLMLGAVLLRRSPACLEGAGQTQPFQSPGREATHAGGLAGGQLST